MRNEATSTLEGRVTRVSLCLSALGTPFSWVSPSEILSPFARKRSGTRRARPSNFLRNEPMLSECRFKVLAPRPPRLRVKRKLPNEPNAPSLAFFIQFRMEAHVTHGACPFIFTKRSHCARRGVQRFQDRSSKLLKITKRTHSCGSRSSDLNRPGRRRTAEFAKRSQLPKKGGKGGPKEKGRNLRNEPIRRWRDELHEFPLPSSGSLISVSSVFNPWLQILTTKLPNEPMGSARQFMVRSSRFKVVRKIRNEPTDGIDRQPISEIREIRGQRRLRDEAISHATGAGGEGERMYWG